MSLTSEEKKQVEELWSQVSKDLKGNSILVFLNFFEMFPEENYQGKFRAFATVPFEGLKGDKRFGAHTFTAISALDGMINNLDDEEFLSQLLIKTGANHKKHGLTIQDFKNFETSLLTLFSKLFRELWTPEVEAGWGKIFLLINDNIQMGLESKGI